MADKHAESRYQINVGSASGSMLPHMLLGASQSSGDGTHEKDREALRRMPTTTSWDATPNASLGSDDSLCMSPDVRAHHQSYNDGGGQVGSAGSGSAGLGAAGLRATAATTATVATAATSTTAATETTLLEETLGPGSREQHGSAISEHLPRHDSGNNKSDHDSQARTSNELDHESQARTSNVPVHDHQPHTSNPDELEPAPGPAAKLVSPTRQKPLAGLAAFIASQSQQTKHSPHYQYHQYQQHHQRHQHQHQHRAPNQSLPLGRNVPQRLSYPQQQSSAWPSTSLQHSANTALSSHQRPRSMSHAGPASGKRRQPRRRAGHRPPVHNESNGDEGDMVLTETQSVVEDLDTDSSDPDEVAFSGERWGTRAATIGSRPVPAASTRWSSGKGRGAVGVSGTGHGSGSVTASTPVHTRDKRGGRIGGLSADAMLPGSVDWREEAEDTRCSPNNWETWQVADWVLQSLRGTRAEAGEQCSFRVLDQTLTGKDFMFLLDHEEEAAEVLKLERRDFNILNHYRQKNLSEVVVTLLLERTRQVSVAVELETLAHLRMRLDAICPPELLPAQWLFTDARGSIVLDEHRRMARSFAGSILNVEDSSSAGLAAAAAQRGDIPTHSSRRMHQHQSYTTHSAAAGSSYVATPSPALVGSLTNASVRELGSSMPAMATSSAAAFRTMSSASVSDGSERRRRKPSVPVGINKIPDGIHEQFREPLSSTQARILRQCATKLKCSTLLPVWYHVLRRTELQSLGTGSLSPTTDLRDYLDDCQALDDHDEPVRLAQLPWFDFNFPRFLLTVSQIVSAYLELAAWQASHVQQDAASLKAQQNADAESSSGRADSNISHQGYLTKQGAVFKSWRRRWFSLSGVELSYGKTPTSSPIRTLDLRLCHDVREDVSEDHPFGLSIHMPDRTYLCYADSAMECQLWLKCLKKASKCGVV
eukprot:m.278850 g.278850  ORF g.278850 m.278850 type:complete len:936 (-) comp19384_c0_seq14:133-2940(-)